jgi:hypothetical protein
VRPPASPRSRVSASATLWRARQTARDPASAAVRARVSTGNDGAVAARLAPPGISGCHQRRAWKLRRGPTPDQLDRRRAGRGERVEHRRDVALLAGGVAPEGAVHEGQRAAGASAPGDGPGSARRASRRPCQHAGS